MVMEDTSFLVRIITEAVKGSGERVVIQSNWSTFRDSTENFNDAIFFIGAGIAIHSFLLFIVLPNS